MDVLIIGAGIAGLTAGRELVKQGHEIRMLEKSRGLGGRAATRRAHGNVVDHGAQYFTARNHSFKTQVELWLASGDASIWSRGFHTLSSQGLISAGEGHPRYIFPDGMNTIGKLLAAELDVKNEARASQISPVQNGWRVGLEDGKSLEAERVIVNVPAEQALVLFEDLGDVGEKLRSVEMTPCFSLLAGYAKDKAPSWRGVNIEMNSRLAWVAHDSSKRTEPKDTVLVLHSTPEFAREHYDDDPEEIKTMLLESVQVLGAAYGDPLWTDTQRWRYAMPSKPYGERILKYDNSLLFCGDWCGGAKIEAAYLSGLAAAQKLTE